MQALTLRSLKVFEAGRDFPTSNHISGALARGLPEFTPAVAFNDGSCVIVGSGPSVTSFLPEIAGERRNGRFIVAINGAHDWLVENGVEPDWFVTCDPRPMPQNLRRVNERTTYLIASRCNPQTFDALKGRNVILWHSASSNAIHTPLPGTERIEWADLDLTDECETWRGRFGVGGGSTSGLRALYLGFLSGFRKFILYGFDSCLAPDGDTKRFTGERVGGAKRVDIIVGGRTFWCNGALAQQANEFQEVYQLPNITIDAKGDGLIAAIIAERRNRGYAS